MFTIFIYSLFWFATDATNGGWQAQIPLNIKTKTVKNETWILSISNRVGGGA